MNKKEAWRYYKTWMREKTKCNLLGCNIQITRKGWDHINLGTKLNPRRKQDRAKRFRLLKLAKKVIKESDDFEKRIKNNFKYFSLTSSKVKNVKVVIREDSIGKKIFFSVMKIKK